MKEFSLKRRYCLDAREVRTMLLEILILNELEPQEKILLLSINFMSISPQM